MPNLTRADYAAIYFDDGSSLPIPHGHTVYTLAADPAWNDHATVTIRPQYLPPGFRGVTFAVGCEKAAVEAFVRHTANDIHEPAIMRMAAIKNREIERLLRAAHDEDLPWVRLVATVRRWLDRFRGKSERPILDSADKHSGQ